MRPGGGYAQFTADESMALDIPDGFAREGAGLQLFRANGTGAQRWSALQIIDETDNLDYQRI